MHSPVAPIRVSAAASLQKVFVSWHFFSEDAKSLSMFTTVTYTLSYASCLNFSLLSYPA